jgi:hypothetical protein
LRSCVTRTVAQEMRTSAAVVSQRGGELRFRLRPPLIRGPSASSLRV